VSRPRGGIRGPQAYGVNLCRLFWQTVNGEPAESDRPSNGWFGIDPANIISPDQMALFFSRRNTAIECGIVKLLPEISGTSAFLPRGCFSESARGQLNAPHSWRITARTGGPFDPGEMIFILVNPYPILRRLSCSRSRSSCQTTRQRLTAVSLGPRIRRVGLDPGSLR